MSKYLFLLFILISISCSSSSEKEATTKAISSSSTAEENQNSEQAAVLQVPCTLCGQYCPNTCRVLPRQVLYCSCGALNFSKLKEIATEEKVSKLEECGENSSEVCTIPIFPTSG